MIFSCPIHLEIKPNLNIVTICLLAKSKDISTNENLNKSIERDMVTILLRAYDIATDFKGIPQYGAQDLASREEIGLAACSSYLFPSIQEAKQYIEEIKTSLI